MFPHICLPITRPVIMRHQLTHEGLQNSGTIEGRLQRSVKRRVTDCVFGTYTVRRDVVVGSVEADVAGETVLAHFHGSGSGDHAVHIGDVVVSECVKQSEAVVVDLQVFREGRQQTEQKAGPGFKHRRVANSCGGESRGRRWFLFEV